MWDAFGTVVEENDFMKPAGNIDHSTVNYMHGPDLEAFVSKRFHLPRGLLLMSYYSIQYAVNLHHVSNS